MKKKTLFLLLFFIIQNSFSQNSFIKIELEINNSLRKGYDLNILIFQKDTFFVVKVKNSLNNNIDSIQNENIELDTSYYINKSQFYDIVNLLTKIEPNKIFQKQLNEKTWIGIDGINCKLNYGTYQNYIILNIWSPDDNTKKRNLENFLFVCKKIILLANLKPEKYLQ